MIIHRTMKKNRSKKYQWHGSQIMIMMMNIRKRADLNLSGKEKVYNDVTLSEFVLPYFVLGGRLSFIPMDPPMDRISRAETLYPEKCGFPLHWIGDVRGLKVTTSIAIPASFSRCALFPYRGIHLTFLDRSFLGLTHGLASLLHFSPAQRELVPE